MKSALSILAVGAVADDVVSSSNPKHILFIMVDVSLFTTEREREWGSHAQGVAG
jgi:hypothetical protein